MNYFVYNGEIIPYFLTRKNVKNINMRVSKEGISVSAPKRVSVATVEDVLKKHGENLLEAYQRLSSRVCADTDISDGKKPCYPENSVIDVFGKKYRIAYNIGKPCVKTADGILTVFQHDPENVNKRQKLINDYLAQLLDMKVREYLAKIEPVMNKRSIPFPNLDYRMMTSRWGSCISAKNRVCLNIALCFKGEEFMKNTVIHELAHYLHHNHSRMFYVEMENMKNEAKLL